jgi:hypothetical protein
MVKSKKAISHKILATAILLAVLGLALAYSCAKAATFAGLPPMTAVEVWRIQVVFLIDHKIVDTVGYGGDDTFASSEICERAALADTSFQNTVQDAGVALSKEYGSAMTVAVVCAMDE